VRSDHLVKSSLLSSLPALAGSRTDLVLHAEYNFYTDTGVGVNGNDANRKTMLVGLDFVF
jgi:hypothetical protein